MEKSGVRLYEIADVIDVTYQTVQCYRDRNNYPTAKNLIKLSEHYNIPVDEMLFYGEERPPLKTSEEFTLLRLFREMPKDKQKRLLEYLTKKTE